MGRGVWTPLPGNWWPSWELVEAEAAGDDCPCVHAKASMGHWLPPRPAAELGPRL